MQGHPSSAELVQNFEITANELIKYCETNYPTPFHSTLVVGIVVAAYLGWAAARYFYFRPKYHGLFLKILYPLFTVATIGQSIFFEAHTWSGGLMEFWPMAFAMGMLLHIVLYFRPDDTGTEGKGDWTTCRCGCR